MAASVEDVEGITRQYLADFKDRAASRIDDNISRAIGGRQWDEAHKWQRVKSRLLETLEAKPRPRSRS